MEEKTSQPTTKTKMAGIGELFSSTWEFYHAQLSALFTIALIVMAPSIISAIMMFFGLGSSALLALTVILGLASLIVSIWGSAAMILFIKNPKTHPYNVG